VDEKTLLERCKQGDREAISEVEHEYRRRVRARIVRIFHWDQHLVEDLTGQVFRKARRGKIRHSNLAGWIFTIQRNLCIDKLRKIAVAEKKQAKALQDIKDQTDEKENEFSNLFGNQKQHRALEVCMEMIDKRRSEVLIMRYEGKYSYQRMADTLEVPLGTVKSRIFRGKADLRKLLREKYPTLFRK
jgi:RNA polymerase sigma-70 factor (ECF subfamily)